MENKYSQSVPNSSDIASLYSDILKSFNDAAEVAVKSNLLDKKTSNSIKRANKVISKIVVSASSLIEEINENFNKINNLDVSKINSIVTTYSNIYGAMSEIFNTVESLNLEKRKPARILKRANRTIIKIVVNAGKVLRTIEKKTRGIKVDTFIISNIKDVYTSFYSLNEYLVTLQKDASRFRYKKFRKKVIQVVSGANYLITSLVNVGGKGLLKSLSRFYILNIVLKIVSSITLYLVEIFNMLDNFKLGAIKSWLIFRNLKYFIEHLEENLELLMSLNQKQNELANLKLTVLLTKWAIITIVELSMLLDELPRKRVYIRAIKKLDKFFDLVTLMVERSNETKAKDVLALRFKTGQLEKIFGNLNVAMKRVSLFGIFGPLVIPGIRLYGRVLFGVHKTRRKKGEIVPIDRVGLFDIMEQIGERKEELLNGLGAITLFNLAAAALIIGSFAFIYEVIKLSNVPFKTFLAGMSFVVLAIGAVIGVTYILSKLAQNKKDISAAKSGIMLLDTVSASITVLVAGKLSEAAITLGNNGAKTLLGISMIIPIIGIVFGVMVALKKFVEYAKVGKGSLKNTVIGKGIEIFDILIASLTTLIGIKLTEECIKISSNFGKITVGLMGMIVIIGTMMGVMHLLKTIAEKEGVNAKVDIKNTLIGKGIAIFDLITASLTILVGIKLVSMCTAIGSNLSTFFKGFAGLTAIIGLMIGIMYVLGNVAKNSGIKSKTDIKNTLIGKGLALFDLVTASLTILVGMKLVSMCTSIGSNLSTFFKGFAGLTSIIGLMIGIMYLFKFIAKSEGIKAKTDLKNTLIGKGLALFDLVTASITTLIAANLAKTCISIGSNLSSFFKGLLGVVSVIGMMIGIMYLFKFIAKKEGIKSEAGLKNSLVMRGIKLFDAVAASIILVVGVGIAKMAKGINSDVGAILAGIGGTMLIIVAMMGIMYFLASPLNILNNKKAIRKIAISILVITAVVLALIPAMLAIALISMLCKNPAQILLGIGSILIILGAVMLLTAGLALFGSIARNFIVDIAIGLSVITIVCAALILIAAELLAVTLIASGVQLLPILKIIGIALAVTALFTILGVALVAAWPLLLGLIAGIGVLTTVITGVYTMAKKLNKISKMDIDKDKVINTVNAITDCLNGMLAAFDGISVRDMNQLKKKTRKLNRIVHFIGKMAKTIQMIATLKVPEYDDSNRPTGQMLKMQKKNFKDAISNSEEMIKSILAIFVDESGNPTKVMTDLENINTRVKRKMRQLSKITNFMSQMATTVQSIASLSMDEFDSSLHPTGKKVKMTAQDFKDATINGMAIMTTMVAMFKDEETTFETSFGSVTIHGFSEADLVNITNKTKRKMRQLTKITNSMGTMANVVQQIASLSIPTEYNEEGKPIKFERLKPEDFNKVVDNVAYIIKILTTSMVDAVKDSEIENVKKRSLKKAKLALEATGGLSEIANTIISLATGSFPIIELDSNRHAVLDSNGNPVMKYLTLEEIGIDKACTTISKMLTNFLDKIGGIFMNNYWVHRVNALNNVMKDGLPIEGISSLVDEIVKLAVGQFPVFDLNADGTAKLDKNGNPILIYKKREDIDINGATKTIADILMNFITNMSNVFLNTKGKAKPIVKQMEDISSMLSGKEGIFDIVSTLVDSALKMGQLKDTSKLQDNFKTILHAFIVPIRDIQDETIEKLDVRTSKLPNYVKAITSLLDDEVLKLSNSNFNANKFKTSMSALVEGYTQPIINIQPQLPSISTSLSTFDRLTSTALNMFSVEATDTVANNIKTSFTAVGELMTKVNGMDTTKLDKMATISKSMATFATKINGNFQGLAKVMNENIITALDAVKKALDELKEELENMPEKVGDAVGKGVENVSTNTSSPVSDTSTTGKNNSKEKDKKKEQELKEAQKKAKALENAIDKLVKCVEGDRLKVKQS